MKMIPLKHHPKMGKYFEMLLVPPPIKVFVDDEDVKINDVTGEYEISDEVANSMAERELDHLASSNDGSEYLANAIFILNIDDKPKK